MDIDMDIAGDPNPFPACAACRCQRVTCGPDCVLAPYFPAGSEAHFTRIDNLVGAGNVADMIKTLHRAAPDSAARTLQVVIAEFLRRKFDPGRGVTEAAATTPFQDRLQEAVEASSSGGQNFQERGNESSQSSVEERINPASLRKVQELRKDESPMQVVEAEPTLSYWQNFRLQNAIRELHELIAQQEEEERRGIRKSNTG